MAGFAGVDLPTDAFALYHLRHGADAALPRPEPGLPPGLSSDDIAKLEVGYVGRPYKLHAYETGGFSGAPRNLPKGVPVWQDHGFGFESRLCVVGERK